MVRPMRFDVVLEGGPLGGKYGLHVEQTKGKWPPTVVWETDDGERVEYRFKQMGLGQDRGRPIYEYVGPATDDVAKA